MNRRFYHSLMLTRAFFRTFDQLRYRGVPIARVMFYSFHRHSMRWKGGGKPRKNWPAHKKKLYAQLVKPEPIRKMNYPQRQAAHARILYTPEAASGLTLSPGETIICGLKKNERKKYVSRGISFIIPHQTPLNRRAFRLIYRAFVKRARNKRTSRYFKRKTFLRWLHATLPDAIRTIDGCYKLFRQYNVKGVVVHSSVHPLGYTLTHMGKQRNMPTITLQYGINDDYQLMSTYSSNYVAWGRSHKRRLTQFGVPPNKIITIGAARFDPIFQKKWKTKLQLTRSLRISSRKWVFVYPEQPLPYGMNRKALLSIIRALYPHRRNIVLLVKPHPKQKKLTMTRQELQRYRFVKRVNHRMPLYDLISGSNAVFVQFSTVGIETILLNRPLISIALFRNTVKHEFSYYAASKSITSARNQRQLNAIVNKVIRSRPYRHAMLRKQKAYRKNTYAGTVSAERIQQYIHRICK